MRAFGAFALALLACIASGCACGVERHPHQHVVRQIQDDDLTLESLYCPDLDLTGIGSAPWFHGRQCVR